MVIAHKCAKITNETEYKNNIPVQSKVASIHQQCIEHNSINTANVGASELDAYNSDEPLIENVIRYSSWHEYKEKHPLRAKAINSLGLNLTTKSDEDASEWLFSIETTAHDSGCKISELKRKYFESVEKYISTDADWIFLINAVSEFAKKESEKYNLKLGNTAGDMLLLFVLSRVREIESKYARTTALTKTDPQTLAMRFMLESDDDVLMLQKMHIYLCKYPMTEQNKKYRDICHAKVLSIIENRIAPYENLKDSPTMYNMAVKTEIFKYVHDEIIEGVPQSVVEEFNEHLLSFYEEMEIISDKASEQYTIRV